MSHHSVHTTTVVKDIYLLIWIENWFMSLSKHTAYPLFNYGDIYNSNKIVRKCTPLWTRKYANWWLKILRDYMKQDWGWGHCVLRHEKRLVNNENKNTEV